MVETDGLLNNSSENELVTKQRPLASRGLSEKKDAPPNGVKKSDVIIDIVEKNFSSHFDINVSFGHVAIYSHQMQHGDSKILLGKMWRSSFTYIWVHSGDFTLYSLDNVKLPPYSWVCIQMLIMSFQTVLLNDISFLGPLQLLYSFTGDY